MRKICGNALSAIFAACLSATSWMIGCPVLALIVLTQPDGKPVWVNTEQVAAVHEAADPPKGGKAQLRISAETFFTVREPADEVAARVNLSVHFTLPDGSSLWINPQQVTGIGYPVAGTKGANSELRMTESLRFYLLESPEEVGAAISPLLDKK